MSATGSALLTDDEFLPTSPTFPSDWRAARREIPSDGEILFASRARIYVTILTMSYPPEGMLALTRDRHLTFVTQGSVLYDWPITGITKVRTPWYQMGAGLGCTIDGSKYLISFSRLSSTRRHGALVVLGGGAVAAAAGLTAALPLAGDVIRLMDTVAAGGLRRQWQDLIVAARETDAPSE